MTDVCNEMILFGSSCPCTATAEISLFACGLATRCNDRDQGFLSPRAPSRILSEQFVPDPFSGSTHDAGNQTKPLIIPRFFNAFFKCPLLGGQ